jgi:serine/threonine-protein kinase
VIGGKYEIRRVIGEGGMGVVYEARHNRLRKLVAIKMLGPEAAAEPDGAVRFDREARAAAQLHSVNAVRVLDVEATDSGLPYMVLELLYGNDLADEIAIKKQMPFESACDYVRQAANAMIEAHELGIIHRDLKPANLFLCKLKGTERRLVKVLDFGISKIVQMTEQYVTANLSRFGTVPYMSPEQLRDTSTADARADLWSLGVILYESITGRCPFEGEPTNVISAISADPVPPPSVYRADIPFELEKLLMRLLEKDRQKRFQSARELHRALAAFAPKEGLDLMVDTTMSEPAPLGRLLIDAGVIDDRTLNEALRAQRDQPSKNLGSILVAMGACDQAAVDKAIQRQELPPTEPLPQGIFQYQLDEPPRASFVAQEELAANRPPTAKAWVTQPQARSKARFIGVAVAGTVVAAAALVVGLSHFHKAPTATPAQRIEAIDTVVVPIVTPAVSVPPIASTSSAPERTTPVAKTKPTPTTPVAIKPSAKPSTSAPPPVVSASTKPDPRNPPRL